MTGPTYGELVQEACDDAGFAVRLIASNCGSRDTLIDQRRLLLSVAGRHLAYIAKQRISLAERQAARHLADVLTAFRGDWERCDHLEGPWLLAAQHLGTAHDILVSHNSNGAPPRTPWAISPDDAASWQWAIGHTAQLVTASAIGAPSARMPEAARLPEIAREAAPAIHLNDSMRAPQITRLPIAPHGLPGSQLRPADAAVNAFKETARLAHLQALNQTCSLATFRFVAITAVIALHTAERIGKRKPRCRVKLAQANNVRLDLGRVIKTVTQMPLLAKAPSQLVQAGLQAKRHAQQLTPAVSAATVTQLVEVGFDLAQTAQAVQSRIPAIDLLQPNRTLSLKRNWTPVENAFLARHEHHPTHDRRLGRAQPVGRQMAL